MISAATPTQQLQLRRYQLSSSSSSFVGMLVAMMMTTSTVILLIVGVLVIDSTIVAAWVPPVCLPSVAVAPAAVTSTVITGTVTVTTKETTNHFNRGRRRQQQRRQVLLRPSFVRTSISMAGETERNIENKTKPSSSSSSLLSFLDDNEWEIVKELHAKASSKAAIVAEHQNDSKEQQEDTFQNTAEQLFSTLSPALIMKLRQGEALIPSEKALNNNNNDNIDDNGNDKQQQQQQHLLHIFVQVSKALTVLTDRRLQEARETLETLLNAGEIKKLDALIGKAARNQKLDAAFFQVIHLNLQDAASAAATGVPVEAQQQITTDDSTTSNEGPASPSTPNRFQILQHIYTRCQEEVEKMINPGTALLNKLLRTEIDSIRENQLKHYLCPAPTTITSPDGTVLDLGGDMNKSLVAHRDFVTAIGNTVTQIRTVEKSGATTTTMAANLVESIRQVAIDARMVIGDQYGGNSSELLTFEEALEQVFRPTTPESPYIQGE